MYSFGVHPDFNVSRVMETLKLYPGLQSTSMCQEWWENDALTRSQCLVSNGTLKQNVNFLRAAKLAGLGARDNLVIP